MSSLSIREINANFKRLISIFKKENDLDYKASVDKKIAKVHKGAKSTEVVLDSRALIVTPPKDGVPQFQGKPLRFQVLPQGQASEAEDKFPDYVKIKLVYIPADENGPESIQHDNLIATQFGGRSQYAALFEAIQRFNNIAEWKSLPEETRREAMQQYKEEKPYLREQFANEPNRPISIV